LYCFDAGTPLTAGTWQAARRGADCALSAAAAVLAGQRAAFALARDLAADFRAAHPAAAWRGCAADGGCKLPTLEAALRKWQEPAAAGGKAASVK
jgi:hypothetical protein